MKKFIIHMKSNDGSGVMPYPYIVNEQGFVGRQKFWKGTPKRLLGFNSTPVAGEMNVVTFFNKPQIISEDIMLGINRYPVFEDADGNWYTVGTEVEKITEITK